VLQVTIPEREFYDENREEFVKTKSEILQLEHSLVSLSKWESKWCKPFLGKEEKSNEETLDYIRCMTISQNVTPEIYNNLPGFVFAQITEYINAPMTATWFNEQQNAKKSREIVTAELVYYWMIAQNIPMECQKWHLNRLLTLIRVCSIKNQPPKKMGRKEMLLNRRALNEARRSEFNTKG
jgi:hypothetical protein